MRIFCVLAMAAVLATAGCGVITSPFGPVSSEPLAYRARVAKSADDPRDYVVRVRAGAATLDMFRESARFYAVRYCLRNFGASDALWVLDPVSGDWDVRREGDAALVQGRCIAR